MKKCLTLLCDIASPAFFLSKNYKIFNFVNGLKVDKNQWNGSTFLCHSQKKWWKYFFTWNLRVNLRMNEWNESINLKSHISCSFKKKPRSGDFELKIKCFWRLLWLKSITVSHCVVTEILHLITFPDSMQTGFSRSSF